MTLQTTAYNLKVKKFVIIYTKYTYIRVKILRMYRVGQHSFIILIYTELRLP